VEPEFEEPKEQPQAEDFINKIWIKTSLGVSHPTPDFYFEFNIFMLWMIVYYVDRS
jgi:hypothetical protein